MNDTNNNLNENGTGSTQVNTPVQENIPATPVVEQPVAAEQPVAQVAEAPAEVKPAEAEAAKETTETSAVEGTTEQKSTANYSFPTVVVVLIAVLGILAVLYFFVLIKPSNVYIKLLKTTANNLIHIDSIYQINEPHTNYSVVSKVNTKGTIFDQKPSLEYLDGLEYYIEFNKNNKSDSYKLNIESNMEKLAGKDNMKYNQLFHANAYFIDDKLYYKTLDGRFARVSEGSNKQNESKLEVINTFVNYMIDSIDISKVTSSLESVVVSDQTVLTIAYRAKFNNEDLNKILQGAIDKSLNDEELLNKVLQSDIMDVTIDEVKAMLGAFKNIEIKAENVEFIYNVNLAFTDMIAMKFVIDDREFQISTLNNMYYIDCQSSGDDKLNIDLAFNANTNEINGSVLIDNENAYSYVEIISEGHRNENTYHLEKLIYDIKLYGEDSKNSGKKSNKPYLTLNNVVNYTYDEVDISVGGNVIDIEEVTTAEGDKINYVSNKFIYELAYLGTLITQNRAYDNPKEYLENAMAGMGTGDVENTPNVDETPVTPQPDVEVVPDTNQTIEDESNDVVENPVDVATSAE